MEEWFRKLSECKTNIDRALLARDLKCHERLLKVFCYEDLDPIVVEEAILNPYAEDHWVKHALTRFPELDTEGFWVARSRNIENLKKEIEKQGISASGDRDQVILKHIIKKTKKELKSSDIVFKNPVVKWKETSKYKVALIMAPSWGIIFPPYNMAKLASVLRELDYSTKVYDLNIESYHALKDNDESTNYWSANNFYYWIIRENFQTFLLPKLKPVFDKMIDELVEANPKVIGFSVYNTNMWATNYLIKEVKNRIPDACIIVGGPEVTSTGKVNSIFLLNKINYLFIGEAEETLPSLLENLPDEYPMHQYIGSTDSKLKLEDFPYIDYSDYNLSNYVKTDGISMETSRGCIAKCTYCAETLFWKFRTNEPQRLVEEIEYHKKTLGINYIWFVDSLINGNLKVFEQIVDLLIEKDLNIKWNCYARADGRMTKDFLAKVVKSGCAELSYGIESGSQKVLHDMRKKVNIKEIEDNMRDGYEVGLSNHANWMVGYPTEEPIDVTHSLTLLSNCRFYIDAISTGFTVGLPVDSPLRNDHKLYGIVGGVDSTGFLNNWYTNEFKNTILHRFIRLKLTLVWLDILDIHANSIIDNPIFTKDHRKFYKVKINGTAKKYIEYNDYLKLNRLDDSILENSVANEYFTIVYMLYILFGSSEFEIEFDPEIDMPLFGNTLVNNYTSKFKVTIKENGEYSLSLKHKFMHDQHVSLFGDKSFDVEFTDNGNVNDWTVSEKQVKETVHEQYRKKVFTILPADE